MLTVLVLIVGHSIFCIFQTTNQTTNTNCQFSSEVKITSTFNQESQYSHIIELNPSDHY